MSEKLLPGAKTGMAPGTLIYEGDTEPRPTSVKYIRITENSAVKEDHRGDGRPALSADSLLWIRITGLADIGLISSVGSNFGIDSLILEDILETSQRPKYEGLADCIFIIMKQINIGRDASETVINQLSTLIGANYMITFEEEATKDLDILEKRVYTGGGAFFSRGSGYLAYALLDILVDSYLCCLDAIETEIEDMEDAVLSSDGPGDAEGLFNLKRRVNILHRSTRPTYEIVEKLMKPAAGEIPVVKKSAAKYLRDLADQAVRLSDSIQSSKEAINALYDENMSRIQMQTNRVINILTSFSVLLLPPMVVAGIFGMNFSEMPGLSWKFGFAAAVGAMTLMSSGMLIFFKCKKFF